MYPKYNPDLTKLQIQQSREVMQRLISSGNSDRFPPNLIIHRVSGSEQNCLHSRHYHQCRSCGEVKQLDQIPVAKRVGDKVYRGAICRDCASIQMKRWILENPDKYERTCKRRLEKKRQKRQAQLNQAKES